MPRERLSAHKQSPMPKSRITGSPPDRFICPAPSYTYGGPDTVRVCHSLSRHTNAQMRYPIRYMQTLSAYRHKVQGTACNGDWSKTILCHVCWANDVSTKLQACTEGGVFSVSVFHGCTRRGRLTWQDTPPNCLLYATPCRSWSLTESMRSLISTGSNNYTQWHYLDYRIALRISRHPERPRTAQNFTASTRITKKKEYGI